MTLSRVRDRVMVLNAIFNNISVIYCGGQLYQEKTTDLSQAPDKLYNIIVTYKAFTEVLCYKNAILSC